MKLAHEVPGCITQVLCESKSPCRRIYTIINFGWVGFRATDVELESQTIFFDSGGISQFARVIFLVIMTTQSFFYSRVLFNLEFATAASVLLCCL